LKLILKNSFNNQTNNLIMQKKTLLFLALVVSLCFSACIKDNKSTAKTVDAIQSKVNVGNAFIVKDDRADKTQKPFSTYSDTRQLIKNYWGDTKQEQILNEMSSASMNY
jgi:hypothetical protein